MKSSVVRETPVMTGRNPVTGSCQGKDPSQYEKNGDQIPRMGSRNLKLNYKFFNQEVKSIHYELISRYQINKGIFNKFHVICEDLWLPSERYTLFHKNKTFTRVTQCNSKTRSLKL